MLFYDKIILNAFILTVVPLFVIGLAHADDSGLELVFELPIEPAL